MGIQLFEHNQKAYDAAVFMMEEHGKAAIIHPTGTGKSFIAFKLAEEHPEAKICWLAPSEYIYHTQLENVKRTLSEGETIGISNIRFLSYSKLMRNAECMEQLEPDYIVLDEFHRCGAMKWGKSVHQLLAKFPSAKVIGLSATNIRYLDNQRDMAQEIFEGNIASEMTLGEAIAKGILSAPKYVTALYSYEKELKKLERMVRTAGNCENTELLNQLRRALEHADGLDKIFDRHLRKKHGKYIVFCADKDHMDEMKRHVPEWFRLVDVTPHIYTVYYNSPHTNKEFTAFRTDNSRHLKLLFCIDMLNEGVHVDGIDGVILLRPTVSPVIYMQQIGRALTAGTSGEPIIIDLVNNFESLICIDYLKQEIEEFSSEEGNFMEKTFSSASCSCMNDRKWNEKFQIIDEVRDCRKIFKQLQANLASGWEIYYRAAQKYYEETGNLRIPKNYITPNGLTLGSWIQTQRKVFSGAVTGALTEEKIYKLNKIGMVWNVKSDSWEEAYRELTIYYNKHGNVDVKARYCCENGFRLGRWVNNLRAKVKKSGVENVLTMEQREKLEALGMVWDKNSEKWNLYIHAAKEYHEKYGNIKVPANYRTADGLPLGSWLRAVKLRMSDEKKCGEALSEEQIEQLNTLGIEWEKDSIVLWNRKMELARDYYKQYGNLNVPLTYCVEGVKLGKWISNVRSKRRNPQSSGIMLNEDRIRQLDSIGMNWK